MLNIEIYELTEQNKFKFKINILLICIVTLMTFVILDLCRRKNNEQLKLDSTVQIAKKSILINKKVIKVNDQLIKVNKTLLMKISAHKTICDKPAFLE